MRRIPGKTGKKPRPFGLSEHAYQESLADDRRALQLEADLLGLNRDEWLRWKIDHLTLTGHIPVPEFRKGGRFCVHPSHDEAHRLILGANIALHKDRIHPTTERTLDDASIPGAEATNTDPNRTTIFTDGEDA